MTTGVQESKLGSVIDRFYEAAVEPALWRTVLHEYAEAVGGGAAILLPGPSLGMRPVNSEAFDEAVETGNQQGWFIDNPRVTRGMPLMRGPYDIMTEERIFAQEELDRLPWYSDYIHRFGFGSFAGLYLVPDGLSSIMLSVERTRGQGFFQASELDVISRALPHLQRAGQIAVRLAGARAEGVLDGFEMLNCGGVLLDVMGRAIRLNAQAERHLGRGLLLTHGHLGAQHRHENTALQRLLGSVLQPGPVHQTRAESAVAISRPEGRPLIVHAAPIVGGARNVFQRAKAILMIVDPEEHQEPSIPVLRQAFGLSPAEARLAAEIGTGRDLKEIALSHGVSEGTVRAQLKAIFAKTDTHRQAELVALINKLISPVLKG